MTGRYDLHDVAERAVAPLLEPLPLPVKGALLASLVASWLARYPAPARDRILAAVIITIRRLVAELDRHR